MLKYPGKELEVYGKAIPEPSLGMRLIRNLMVILIINTSHKKIYCTYLTLSEHFIVFLWLSE
jgi:hypothetical protein